MGTYTTYFGRVRLSKSTPTHIQQALTAMVQGKDTIDGKPFFLQRASMYGVFLDGEPSVTEHSHLANFCATKEGFTLTFCATSKWPIDDYEWLLGWLMPWFDHDMGDMLMAIVSENYLTDYVVDEVIQTGYCWTPWRWGWNLTSQIDSEAPWDTNPWFKPFTIEHE